MTLVLLTPLLVLPLVLLLGFVGCSISEDPNGLPLEPERPLPGERDPFLVLIYPDGLKGRVTATFSIRSAAGKDYGPFWDSADEETVATGAGEVDVLITSDAAIDVESGEVVCACVVDRPLDTPGLPLLSAKLPKPFKGYNHPAFRVVRELFPDDPANPTLLLQ